MAVTVPSIFQEQVRTRPARQQGVDVQATPAAFGADIGRGLGQLGQGVGEVAQALAMRQAVEDEAKARESLSAFMDERRELLFNPETGILTRTGSGALGNREANVQALRKLREKHGAGLTGAAAATYARGADSLDAAAKDAVIKHEGEQLKAFSGQQSTAIIGSAINEAAVNHQTPDVAEFYMNTAVQELRRQAALEGFAPEAVEVEVLKLTSAALRDRALNQAVNDPIGAAAFVEQNADRMTAKDAHDLTTGLEGAVVEAQAFGIVTAALGGATTGSSSRDPAAEPSVGGNAPVSATPRALVGVQGKITSLASADNIHGEPRWMVAAESSGDPNARPPINPETGEPFSSALGNVQFLRGTYLQNVEEVRDKGGAKWADGLTEAQILATRTNKEQEGEIYRHFRAKNAMALARNGYVISPRNEYIMHHFGARRGPLMLALEASGGAGIKIADNFFSAAEMTANPQYKGMTVAAVMDVLDKKANPSGTTSNPSAAFEVIQNTQDLKVQSRAMEIFNQMVLMEDRAVARDRADAMDEAGRMFLENGTTVDQLPVSSRLRIGPNGLVALQAAQENLLAGIDFTDEAVKANLNKIFLEDPATAAEVNLLDYAPTLSSADLTNFQNRQDAVRKERNAPVGSKVDFSQLRIETLDLFQGATGFRPGASASKKQMKQFNRFEDQMRAGVTRFFETEGRNMNATETRELASTLLLEGFIGPPGPLTGIAPNFLLKGESGFVFEVPHAPAGAKITLDLKLEDLPRAEREELATEFQADFGRPPTPDELLRANERKVLTSAGIVPNMTINDVPQKEIDKVRNRLPTATDDQIIQIYTAFLLQRGGR